MELILIPMVNFGEVRRAQLAKSTLLTFTLVPLGSFKACSDDKDGVGCGKQQEAAVPIKSLVKLQPWFLSLRWKTCLRQNCSLGSCSCSEGPALWQNTLMMMMMMMMMISRPRWSSGYHTRHWIRGSRVQTRPGSMDFSERKTPE